MSNTTNNFLFELGTEELPPKALKGLAKSLLSSVESQLKDAGVAFDETKWFASPRRLAFIIEDLAQSQEDITIEKQGPLVSIAYNDAEPTKVGLGFAKSCGVDINELERIDTPKGEKLYYKSIQQGQKTTELLQNIITKALKQLPIPKMMRWGNSEAEFVRPVHWVVAMYGSDIVDIELFGKKASNLSFGHRFHDPKAIAIKSAFEYVSLLADAMVVVDWDERKAEIIKQAKAVAKQNGYKVVLDNELVEEVCAIVEHPNAMMCSFDESFLRVPQEALISSMEEHQKCFALLDGQNNLVANFITISNIKSTKPELVISGNQKVMNARLADAAFFYDTDLKTSLESLLPKLESVTFHNKLGNMHQKAQRLANTSKELAKISDTDIEQSYRAGLLAKADLISDMVFEFTDLQGIIGKYYAKAYGESDVVADAIEQQYWPKYSGAELPETNLANCVALAEKLDTLVGIFGIGQKPTGNKDPFALRRSAIGILRILRDNIDISLEQVIDIAIESYKCINAVELSSNTKVEVINFCLDRLKNLYKEEGVATDIFESISTTNYESIKDFDARVKAVIKFSLSDKAKSLIASNKRVANILNKNATDSSIAFDREASEKAGNAYELALVDSLDEIEKDFEKYLNNREYNYALALLSSIEKVISEFFDNVMVMDEDLQVRNNRIALLAKIRKMFASIADISKL
ncbi:glycine--tRNA ligase subunit beta [Francisella adeliensis]|uniref:Glycine--tRNA ligase beta subunit n=1 Tax=Francisella adeliensis TaxID=2007306 RepID=A0A2Z4XY09_9GAMM|nr:glycine--tRNA ligase subunit beta [Francisella adeliensis]AXA33556.1 glycine--tRNA ligase subunit beta [Francisella adeliensis]MBK2084738.1 glycine--tRNA ligase subunit beta [Francisella adeliensis]MBK2097319.1 glycine--tRNA ligase subunit beta [Francisella adeliensis]QIW11787.1 glycine--tRNA ligase subunit beta [Francisella adeliensis]QIW13663.1 glycine--tRNA ligase subunit beta [Francisella adeliensis]